MNKIILGIVLALTLLFKGCEIDVTTITSEPEYNNDANDKDEVSSTYIADFYDNYGNRFFSVEGKDISIKPNKVKVN